VTFLRSLAFNCAFILWFVICGIVGMPFMLLSKSAIWRLAKIWTGGTMLLLRLLVGVKYEFRNAHLLPDGPFILASKHQSAWDTLIFFLLVDKPVYIHKKELLWLPVLGFYLWRAGMIPVDRSAGKRAVIAIARAARPQLAAGRKIIIFPQGTRTAPGVRAAFRPGVHAIAAAADATVVPIALNSGLYWGRNAFTKRPGTILLEVLPAIEAPHPDRAAFMAVLEARIEEATERLEAEGRARDGV
jgi:1-acyl-sn-glycerol-3-phosphate acyltransferase